MKKILKYTFMLSMVSTLAVGCIEEFEPHGNCISKEQVNDSSAGLEAMASAIANYAANANWDSSGLASHYGLPSLNMIRENYCNDMVEPAVSYSWYSSQAQNKRQGGTQNATQLNWLIQTKIASLCNDIIRMYPDLDDISASARPYVGAAYAYRSLIWLDMARMYEYIPNPYTGEHPEIAHLTIPYLPETLSEDDARHNPRVSKEVMLGYIKDGLEKALDLLGDKSWSDKNIPDKAVTYGLLARAYMWEGDYAKAKEAAQNALAAGDFEPLTEDQWTDPTTGFNSLNTQKSWMLCSRLSNESSSVKTVYTNWTSWAASEYSDGYVGVGAISTADVKFYNSIPDTDWRKKSWKAPAGSSLKVKYLPASGEYGGPESLPDLAVIKFRPGQGDTNDYLKACAVDIPLMRMEEMKFIIAECDARNGSSASLVEIVKTRNPQYTCNKTGNDLIREVFLQKRIELWGEGVMFYDYKRCPDHLRIERGYAGTTHNVNAQFNTEYGVLAPWFNQCINEYETYDNTAIINNPDPTDSMPLWDGR